MCEKISGSTVLEGWYALALAGVFEVGFTTALKMEERDGRWF